MDCPEQGRWHLVGILQAKETCILGEGMLAVLLGVGMAITALMKGSEWRET